MGQEAFAKLLDAWTPPDDAGVPIGCMATSFTFDSVFFEEECLGRFLRMESDLYEDGPIYLLEREEKLAQLRYASAIVDQYHCRGKRSLRWDLMPARVRGGIMHAKVSVLHWSRCVRLIVASANLTPAGYRINHEVFGFLDFQHDGVSNAAVGGRLLDFMRGVVSNYADASDTTKARGQAFLEDVRKSMDEMNVREDKRVRLSAVLVAPGTPAATEQLADVWPEESPPNRARVLSPFFDRDNGGADRPSQAVWSMLRKRGEAGIELHVPTEEVRDEDDSLFIPVPESVLRSQPPGRNGVYTDFCELILEENRPLHAKSLWLESDRWVLYMLGSSNFTSHGLGLSGDSGNQRCNVEANIAYVVQKQRHPRLEKELNDAFLSGELLPEDVPLQWRPAEEEGQDSPDTETIALHPGFKSATYAISGSGAPEVAFVVDDPPPDWTVFFEDDGRVWFDEAQWKDAAAEDAWSLPWSEKRPPCGFWVVRDDVKGRAWWPVNIHDQATLPPPDDLKDLPLDVLIDILTSALPFHKIPALRRFLEKREHEESGAAETQTMRDLDPHRRVDTSRFLLQRSRRVGWALAALRSRLERPVYSQQSLNWRLRGPIGVSALAEALLREAYSDSERGFLLIELALELYRVDPLDSPGSLAKKEVRREIVAMAMSLQETAVGYCGSGGHLSAYVGRVFKEMVQ